MIFPAYICLHRYRFLGKIVRIFQGHIYELCYRIVTMMRIIEKNIIEKPTLNNS